MSKTKLRHENSTRDMSFLLEEVFQLLLESLDHDPFSQRATKKHIARLRQLLGEEFSLLLSETGNLFFSALTTAYDNAYLRFSATENQKVNSMQVYETLLQASYNIMSLGIHSEQTNETLMQMVALTNTKHVAEIQNIHDVVQKALVLLQEHAVKSTANNVVI